MRIFLALILLILLATAAIAVYMRFVTMPPELWHVDPATAAPPDRPNFVLRTGEDAPRLAGTPREVAERLLAVAETEGAVLIAGDAASGHMTFVQRTRLMGYPDAISIRLHAEGDQTRVDLFSRARFGQSDIGVNRARMDRWIAAAAP